MYSSWVIHPDPRTTKGIVFYAPRWSQYMPARDHYSHASCVPSSTQCITAYIQRCRNLIARVAGNIFGAWLTHKTNRTNEGTHTAELIWMEQNIHTCQQQQADSLPQINIILPVQNPTSLPDSELAVLGVCYHCRFL
jgi:hypothetical protein